MTFPEFQTRRAALLMTRPELLDCAETNLYRSLAPLIPEPPEMPENETVHRCHLASQWVEFFGLPDHWARRAFVTSGVRDALDTVFSRLSGKTCRLWLPQDNYPVYHELAVAHGHQPAGFSTLPEPRWPEAWAVSAAAGGTGPEWLLITNPLKPRGRSLAEGDARALEEWLSADAARRVVLDTVYQLGSRFDGVTMRLLETEQVILLHSLTKGWLHPRCFGVALMPEQDAAEWLPAFRTRAPSQTALATARYLMSCHAGMPEEVSKALREAQRRLGNALGVLTEQCLTVDPDSYFLPLEMSWEELLEWGVLGLPGSVFGALNDRFTILSSLSFTHPPTP